MGAVGECREREELTARETEEKDAGGARRRGARQEEEEESADDGEGTKFEPPRLQIDICSTPNWITSGGTRIPPRP